FPTRNGNVVRARENVGSSVVQKSGIQCYNYKEFRHVARECQKPKRENDVAYHREKMLLSGTGSTLYVYGTTSRGSPDAADSGPIFDDEPVQKVSNDDHYNVFAMESVHPEKSKPVHDTYLIEQDAQNVIIDSLDMNYDREEIDQNDDDNDLAKERELLASLIKKLKCEIDESKNRNNFLEISNKVLIEKLKGEIKDFKNNNKSLESSNNFFKEANNKLSETNNLLYADYKKSEAELARRNSKEYASQMELECEKYILNEKGGPKEDACIMSYQSQGVSVWEGAKVVHLQLEYSSRSPKIFSRIMNLIPLDNNEIDFKIAFDESDDEDYMVVFDENSFSCKIISVDNLKTDSENENDKVNITSFLSPEPTIGYTDDLNFFKDFENEFPAIAYNDLKSKSDPLIEPSYLFRHAEGRKSWARLSGGHFIGRLEARFGLVSDQGLRGLSVVSSELPLIDLYELGRLNISLRVGDIWAWVASGPERQQAIRLASQLPPHAPQHQTMLQRIKEEMRELRKSVVGMRGVVESSITEQTRVSTWMIGYMTQLMDVSGRT
nr:hypothetical protein [Tanacetum cinerariifolium]